MRVVGALLLGLVLLVGLSACSDRGGDRSTDPGTTPTAPVDSREAFSAFSGLSIPGTATGVTIKTTVDADGQPAYRVGFALPSDDLDAFCVAGELGRPLRVVTIPDDVRETFSYQGDSSTGVAFGEGGRPDDQRIQRKVFAVGTKTSNADVQVYAYRMPS